MKGRKEVGGGRKGGVKRENGGMISGGWEDDEGREMRLSLRVEKREGGGTDEGGRFVERGME